MNSKTRKSNTLGLGIRNSIITENPFVIHFRYKFYPYYRDTETPNLWGYQDGLGIGTTDIETPKNWWQIAQMYSDVWNTFCTFFPLARAYLWYAIVIELTQNYAKDVRCHILKRKIKTKSKSITYTYIYKLAKVRNIS